MHLRTHHHATINAPPGRSKRFDVAHMRRIPVILSDEARYHLATSNHQGRVIPQALSEFFGTLPDIDHIEVGIDKAKERFVIDVKHWGDEDKHQTFFVALGHVREVSEHPAVGFKGIKKADELLRPYRVQVLKEDE